MSSSNLKDLTGMKFGRLTVIERAGSNKWRSSMWRCKCDCGNENDVVIVSGSLLSGNTQSCGCLNKEITHKMLKKYNTYDLAGKFGIGYTDKGEEFYFDLEDYDLIKNYYWSIDKYKYVVAYDSKFKRAIKLHRLIMNCLENRNIEIDHKKRKRNDNVKENLRIANRTQNNRNGSLGKNNASGYIGVGQPKNKNKWRATITINKKLKHLGTFDTKEDAILARLKAEKDHYGEFAPQKHLYEQYGIE